MWIVLLCQHCGRPMVKAVDQGEAIFYCPGLLCLESFHLIQIEPKELAVFFDSPLGIQIEELKI